MNECWNSIKINEIGVAVYVTAGVGKVVHQNRPYQGIVLNESVGVKEYYFDDGRMMRTGPNALFYLPKGSSYEVKTPVSGGCYAINFDADISDFPFAIKARNVESLRKRFHIACNEWKMNTSARHSASMEAVYDAIYRIQKEIQSQYVTSDKLNMISSAVQEIEQNFNLPCLNVSDLADSCGMSEVYFRKIFIKRFGVSPKEYIIQKRMEYAQRLLLSGEFKMAEIAELCGYTEPCHFSREFKKRFGVSPKKYL